MIIDTSAMVAAPLYGEPEAAAFTRLIHDSAASRISVANYMELSMVIEKQLGPEGNQHAAPSCQGGMSCDRTDVRLGEVVALK